MRGLGRVRRADRPLPGRRLHGDIGRKSHWRQNVRREFGDCGADEAGKGWRRNLRRLGRHRHRRRGRGARDGRLVQGVRAVEVPVFACRGLRCGKIAIGCRFGRCGRFCQARCLRLRETSEHGQEGGEGVRIARYGAMSWRRVFRLGDADPAGIGQGNRCHRVTTSASAPRTISAADYRSFTGIA